MFMRTLVVWGAGRIGRGLVADLFHEPLWRTVFVDSNASLVHRLNERQAYTIFKAQSSGLSRTLIDGGFSALHTSQLDPLKRLFETEALLLDIAVPDGALACVADMLAPLIAHRAQTVAAPMDIMLSVNIAHSSAVFASLLDCRLSGQTFIYYKNSVGITDVMTMCISPDTPASLRAEDELALINNGYGEMAVGRMAFKTECPRIPRLRLSDDIQAENTRKLYTLNMAHALCCYLGVKKNCRTVIEAVADTDIRSELILALDEAALALRHGCGFSAESMAAWRAVILELLDNPCINDDLPRLGADTRRKLSSNDRLCGPARLCLEAGKEPRAIARTIRAGFDFVHDDAGTNYVRSWVAREGLSSAVREICRLTPCDKLFQMILE